MSGYQVTRYYVPPPGSSAAPGEHYTLRAAEPDRRVAPGAYRHYSFYRTARGSEVAADMGYGTGPHHRIAGDGDLFRALKAAVEAFDAGRGR